MAKHTAGKLILISFGSLMVGFVVVPVLFFGTWGLVSVVLEKIWPLQDNLWSFILIIHYLSMFFLLGWLIRRGFDKKQWPPRSIYLTIWLCLPMTVWLYLFAAITDARTVEYIPRFTWVAAPLLGYVFGLAYRRSRS